MRSKDNNQFKIDHSFPGLCSLCHDEIALFDGSYETSPGVFRPRIIGFKSNKREATVILDDGSSMRVPLCVTCYDSLSPEDMGELMESEINGWQKEVDDMLPHWKPERKKSYMKRYSERFVTDRSDKAFSDSEKGRIKKPKKSKLKVKV